MRNILIRLTFIFILSSCSQLRDASLFRGPSSLDENEGGSSCITIFKGVSDELNSKLAWQRVFEKSEQGTAFDRELDQMIEQSKSFALYPPLSKEALKTSDYKKLTKLFKKYKIGQRQLTEREGHSFYTELLFSFYKAPENISESFDEKRIRLIKQRLQVGLLSQGYLESMKKSGLPRAPLLKRLRSHIGDLYERSGLQYPMTVFSNAMIAKFGAFPSMVKGLDFKVKPRDIELFIKEGDKALPQIISQYKTQASVFVITHKVRYLSMVSILSLIYVQYRDYEEDLEKRQEESEQIFHDHIAEIEQTYSDMADVVLSPMEEDFINSYKAEHGRPPSEEEVSDFMALFDS